MKKILQVEEYLCKAESILNSALRFNSQFSVKRMALPSPLPDKNYVETVVVTYLPTNTIILRTSLPLRANAVYIFVYICDVVFEKKCPVFGTNPLDEACREIAISGKSIDYVDIESDLGE